MSDSIILRPATADDAPAIAPLVLMAGGGSYEFMLDGLVPGMGTADLLLPGLAGTAGSFSHRHITVAGTPGGAVVGIAHAYPAEWMRHADRTFIPADRLEHLAAFDALQEWDSLFLSALAVDTAWRRRGIAGRLLDAAVDRAATGGFPSLSLHVWADNAPARRLYARHGFAKRGQAAIPWHPRLPHTGGCVLMVRETLTRRAGFPLWR